MTVITPIPPVLRHARLLPTESAMAGGPAFEAETAIAVGAILTRLDALRAELVDEAFELERRGRLDAADVALATAARIGEMCADIEPRPAASRQVVLTNS